MKKNYSKSIFIKTLLGLLVMQLLYVKGHGQTTYTTQAPGSWSSPATWVGGNVPGSSISTTSVVNIKHRVVFDDNTNININGTLNISGDSLIFPASYTSKVTVSTNGNLNITNGGFVQTALTAVGDLDVNGGRVILSNAYLCVTRDFTSRAGAKRTYVNSKLFVGGNYSVEGAFSNNSYDTIRFTQMEVGSYQAASSFRIKSYGNVAMANAYIQVANNGDFINDLNGKITTAPTANGNFGFDFLRVLGNLKNDGSWVARIDAACVGGAIQGTTLSQIDFTRSQDCSGTPLIGAAPELIFTNPILVSGTDKKQGSVYRFNSVRPGVYALIKLKKFSRPDIVVNEVDLAGMGWDKAFQPNFGLPGTAAPNQKWYIDFELKFYDSATNAIKVMPKVDMTALDVDGDGVSIQEFANFQNPSSVSYSTISNLVNSPLNLVGTLDTCSTDGLINLLASCITCGGDGKTGTWNLDDCSVCNATGLIHTGCNHPYESVNAPQTQGPVANFVNIDTAATQVMSVYTFTDRSVINFRYGATTGASSSNAAMRLNSLWFRQFSLAPVLTVALPVKLESFTTQLAAGNEKVNVRWTTATESNVSHFIVERSADGVNFTSVGSVAATGNTSTSKNYILVDNIKNAGAQLFYYRLRTVDADGQSQKSDIRIVRVASNNYKAINISVFPNPVVNEFRVTLPAGWQGKKVLFEVITSNGQLVQRIQTDNSSQTEVIDATKLIYGMYVVKATCGAETTSQKIIKN